MNIGRRHFFGFAGKAVALAGLATMLPRVMAQAEAGETQKESGPIQASTGTEQPEEEQLEYRLYAKDANGQRYLHTTFPVWVKKIFREDGAVEWHTVRSPFPWRYEATGLIEFVKLTNTIPRELRAVTGRLELDDAASYTKFPIRVSASSTLTIEPIPVGIPYLKFT